MKHRCLIPALLALILAAPGRSFGGTNSVPGDFSPPEKLSLSWFAAPGIASTTITWGGKSLEYENRQSGQTVDLEITPSPAAWAKFWKAMDKVRVWAWHARYENRDVTDGLAWIVNLRHGDKIALSSGRNGYPMDNSSSAPGDTPSAPFLAYQKAVEDLIGRKLWRE